MSTILSIFQVIVCIALIGAVLLHSGKDAGMSGAFGVGGSGSGSSGGSMMERNLNRWTVALAVVFVVNTVVLLKIG